MLRVPRVRLLFEFSFVFYPSPFARFSWKNENINVVYYKSCIKSHHSIRRLRQVPISLCFDWVWLVPHDDWVFPYGTSVPLLLFSVVRLVCYRLADNTLLLPVDPPYSRPGALGQSRSKGSRSFCSPADRKRACSGADQAEIVFRGTTWCRHSRNDLGSVTQI